MLFALVLFLLDLARKCSDVDCIQKKNQRTMLNVSLGLVFIHPLRSQTITFQLKKSNKPNSKLTDVARRHLFEDYLFLQTEEQKRRVAELKVGVKTDNRGRGSFDFKRLADHYCIHPSNVFEIIKRGNTTTDTAAKKRTGRKKSLTPAMVEHIVKQDQLAGGTTTRTLHAILEEECVPEFETTYKGRISHTPSRSTLVNLKKSNEVVSKKLRMVPMIDEGNASERLKWCEENALLLPISNEERIQFCQSLESWVDVDETVLTYSFGTGRILVLRRHDHQVELQNDDLEELSQEGVLTVRDEMKSNPPSILIFSAVTCPRLLNPTTCMEEGAEFDQKRKGIVQVRRVRGEDVYKRKTKFNNAGDAKFVDITVNAKTYGYMMANEGTGLISYLKRYNDGGEDCNRCCAAGIPIELATAKEAKKPDRIRRETIVNMQFDTNTQDSEYIASANYNSDSEDSECVEEDEEIDYSGLRFRIQQDNAGGHGFNNFQGGAATDEQKRMVDFMSERGFDVFCQPRNSPFTNMNDLGFFNSLKAFMRAKSREITKPTGKNRSLIQAQMWGLVKRFVHEFEPRKLFNIAVQKHALMQRCVELEGKEISKEPHHHIRKQWGTCSQ